MELVEPEYAQAYCEIQLLHSDIPAANKQFCAGWKLARPTRHW